LFCSTTTNIKKNFPIKPNSGGKPEKPKNIKKKKNQKEVTTLNNFISTKFINKSVLKI
jgi:hypothetical protein